MRKAAQSKSGPGVRRFEAALERMRSRLNWTIIRMPFDAAKCYGMRGQIKVKVEINGCSFRTSLFPTAEGVHILLVNKRMQKAACVRAGDSARFQIERDIEERVLMAAAHVKHVVDHVSAGRKIRDHGEAVGLIRARRADHVLGFDQYPDRKSTR